MDLIYYLNGFQHRRAKQELVRRIADSDDPAAPYAGLHPSSLGLVGLRPMDGGAPRVNLILFDLRPELVFAGLNTALIAARTVAEAVGAPLRIVVLNVRPGTRTVATIERLLVAHATGTTGIELVYQREIPSARFSASDIWMPTFWTTAHAADVACRLGLVDPARVVYLIQDYEPSFFPFSTDEVLARSTYHAGFVPLVNSTPLATYLRSAEGVDVPDRHVFAPVLDLNRLEQASISRAAGSRVRILFYGRPSKPRNLFSIGIASLRLAARALDGEGVDYAVVSAGEAHSAVALGRAGGVRSLGRLSWDEYFRVLGEVDVVLSLQATPHPSHPPLDGVVSGAISVTNELDRTRGGLHPRLLARTADPEGLAEAVASAARTVREGAMHPYSPEILESLGEPLEDSVRNAALRLG